MIGIGISPMFQNGAVGNQIDALLKTNNIARFKLYDANTITKDVSNKISKCSDFYKGNINLIQNAVLNQGVYTSEGAVFNGFNQFMRSNVTAFKGSETRSMYVVYKNLNTAPSYISSVCGNSLGTTAKTWFLLQCRHDGLEGNPYFAGYADDMGVGLSLPDNKWTTACITYDGATAKLYKNGILLATKTTVFNTVDDLLWVASDCDSSFAKIIIKEIIVRNTVDSDNDRLLIEEYFMGLLINPLADDIITINTKSITETGVFSGKPSLIPSEYYAWPYIRDYAMSIDNYVEGFSAAYIKDGYLWFKSHTEIIGDAAYRVPDGVKLNGELYSLLGKFALDGNPYLISMAYNYYKKTNDTVFITSEIEYLKILIDTLPYTDNLVTCPEGANRVVGWGFYDIVTMTGKLLFVSCLAYRAYRQISEMAQAVGNTVMRDNCDSKMVVIKSAIKTTFYKNVVNKHYMTASTGVCSAQFDLPGTCFAVYLGVIDGVDALNISTYIVSIIDQCVKLGGVRWVPYDHQYEPGVKVWEMAIIDYGYYQLGGWWATSLSWFLSVVKITNPSLAKTIFRDCYNHLHKTSSAEWWAANGLPYNAALNYSTSQTELVLASTIIK